jgi:hypothetical protein
VADQSVERQLLNQPGSGWAFRALHKNEVGWTSHRLRIRSRGLYSTRAVAKTFPTASLMRNDLLNTARQAHIEERKGYKDAQSTPKGTQK